MSNRYVVHIKHKGCAAPIAYPVDASSPDAALDSLEFCDMYRPKAGDVVKRIQEVDRERKR